MYTVHTNNALAVSHCTLGLHTSTYGMYTKSKRQVNSLHINHPRQESHVFLQIELILRLLLPWILHLIPVSTHRNIINVLNANSISSIYLLVLLGVEKMCCLQTNFFKRIVFIAQEIFTISDHNIEFFVELHGNIHLFLPWIVFNFRLFIWGFQWSMQCYSTSQRALLL